ncbi:HET-domain-containing protein [Hypoxylon sp. EC38]|nr:HET-domain-containing protein [Hypoxylon sp. EC38]
MEMIKLVIRDGPLSTEQSGDFKYDTGRLEPDEVRILLLLPNCSQADGSDDIHCYMGRLNLQATEDLNNKKHPFVALSYVWGPVEPERKIYINNREKMVGPGLYEALRHIRDAMAPVPLWIDAICINQDDDDEKSREILKMRRIYAECSQVIYWLGVPDDKAEFVDGFKIQYKKTPARAMAEFGAIYDTLRELGQEHNQNAFDAYNHGVNRFVLVEALSYLLDSPFWRRVWITQEFILSHDGFFMWGPHIFTMKLFDDLLKIHDQVIPRNTFSINLDKYIKAYSMMIESIRMRSSKVRFQEALINVRYRLATNELDYVYGMLGIADVQSLIPNYKKGKEEVYLEAFREVLSQENNLDILSACDRGWAECAAYILEDGKRLCVKGVEFDTVAQIIGISTNDWTEKVIGLWKEGKLSSVYATGDAFKKACEKTELYGRHKSYIIDEFHKQFEGLEEGASVPTVDAQSPELFNEDGDSDDEENVSDSAIQKVFRLDEVTSTIFITQRGLLGRSPSSVEINDKVCIFLGAKVPFLLRQEDQCFKLAGETYIRGIMKGAAMAAMKGQERDFILV